MNTTMVKLDGGLYLMEKARTHKYIKRIPNNKKGKGWIYFYNRQQWDQYKKDGTIPKQEETGSIWSGIMSFFGFKDEAKAESKVKSDYETHKAEVKGVSYESFVDHVSEYFNNKSKWDARINATPKEKGEKKESALKTEPTAKKESSGGEKKFNLSVMRVIAGIYGGGLKDSRIPGEEKKETESVAEENERRLKENFSKYSDKQLIHCQQ